MNKYFHNVNAEIIDMVEKDIMETMSKNDARSCLSRVIWDSEYIANYFIKRFKDKHAFYVSDTEIREAIISGVSLREVDQCNQCILDDYMYDAEVEQREEAE